VWNRILVAIEVWWMTVRHPLRYRCQRCGALLRFDDIHHIGDDYARPFCGGRCVRER